jgi:hypothetical protein
MAKTTGPLLSLDGSGTIAKSITFSRWRGIKYARQRVIPENPNTTAQAETRNVFTMLSAAWKLAPSLVTTPWETNALGRPFTGRNKFIGENVRTLRDQATLALMIGSPGARGGLPPNSITPTPGALQISVAFNNPSAPVDWVITAAQAACVPDQDPSDAFDGLWVAAEDTSDPFTPVVLTGLTAATLYRVFGWLEWTKPDGRTAYSVSLTSSATTP